MLLDTDDFYWVYSREKTEFKQEYVEENHVIAETHEINDRYCIVAHDKKKVIFENIITNDQFVLLSSCNHVEFKNANWRMSNIIMLEKHTMTVVYLTAKLVGVIYLTIQTPK